MACQLTAVGQTRTFSLGATRPLPPSADIGPGGQSVGQVAQFCLAGGYDLPLVALMASCSAAGRVILRQVGCSDNARRVARPPIVFGQHDPRIVLVDQVE